MLCLPAGRKLWILEPPTLVRRASVGHEKSETTQIYAQLSGKLRQGFIVNTFEEFINIKMRINNACLFVLDKISVIEIEHELNLYKKQYGGTFEEVFGSVTDPYQLDEPDDYFDWKELSEDLKRLYE